MFNVPNPERAKEMLNELISSLEVAKKARYKLDMAGYIRYDYKTVHGCVCGINQLVKSSASGTAKNQKQISDEASRFCFELEVALGKYLARSIYWGAKSDRYICVVKMTGVVGLSKLDDYFEHPHITEEPTFDDAISYIKMVLSDI